VPDAPRTAAGKRAEALAADYLRAQGLRLVARNYRTGHGEIDLVLDDRGTLVFVEVRYRASDAFGTPAETVDARKQARLRATAEHYLLARGGSKSPARFDIVAVRGPLDAARLEWLTNVF
jgi:putative endonuclease